MLIIQKNLTILSIYFSSSETFGLYHVDFNDPGLKRTAKKSAQVFSQIIKSNKIPVELLSVKSSLWRSETVGSPEFNTVGYQDCCGYTELMFMVNSLGQAVILCFLCLFFFT
jgi:hypothetical protein